MKRERAYAEGEGVESNSVEGFHWLQKAAAQGDARAERRVGEMLMTGTGTMENVKAGLNWLKKAAAQGDANAQCDLGVDYCNGKIVPKNNEKAFRWLMAAARQGRPTAEWEIATMYAVGQGTGTNLVAAREWFARAAAQNDPQGLFGLGKMYFEGLGGPQDFKRGASCLVRAAMRGEVKSESYLGAAYVTGKGVLKDFTLGTKLLKAAAMAGHAEAQDNYGKCFLVGAGEFNAREAHKWISRAADQGLASGEFDEGWLYQMGLGVQLNEVEALKWFELAAAQGNQEAQSRKKEMLVLLNPSDRQAAQKQADAFKPEAGHPVPVNDSRVVTCPLSRDFLVPVKLFGATKHLLVDTGSSFMSLDNRYRTNLGEPIAQSRVVGSYVSGIAVPIYRAPDVFINGEPLDICWTASVDLSEFGAALDTSCDGVLGMDFLQQHLIRFEPKKGEMSIGGSVPQTIKESTQAVPIEKVANGINGFSVAACINGYTVHLLIDSGLQGEISLSDHDWRQIFKSGVTNFSEQPFAGMGTLLREGKVIKLPSLFIGTNRYANLKTDLVPGKRESALGQEFIRKYVPAIDFPHRMLYILPPHSSQKP